MEKISNILIPFDFSDSAQRALEYAVKFVANRAVKINLLHISDHEKKASPTEAYETYQNKYASQLKLPIRWILGWGDFTKTIIDARDDKNTEIIIMGTSGFDEDKTSSNASRLVIETECPVIIVPENTPKNSIKNICLVLGKEEIDNPKSLKVLLEVTRTFGAQVHVLTVQNTDETYGYSEADQKNENTLMYYLEEFYADHTFIENKDVVTGIFNYSKTHNIDLIGIIPRNHTKKSKPSKGQLTKELVLKSNIPVLTVE